MTKRMEFQTCPHCKQKYTRDFVHQKFCSLRCAVDSRVQKAGPDDCWPWTAGAHTHGYGRFGWKFGTRYAHRTALELSGVEIPPDAHIMHSCDNPPCCNPAHLSVGTNSMNIKDMWAKGRGKYPPPALKGEEAYAAKLTWPIVRAIRADFAKGMFQRAVAAKYGTTQANAHRIKKRAIWKDDPLDA